MARMSRNEKFPPQGPFVFRTPTQSFPPDNMEEDDDSCSSPTALMSVPDRGPVLASNIIPHDPSTIPALPMESMVVTTYFPNISFSEDDDTPAVVSPPWMRCDVKKAHDESTCCVCKQRHTATKVEGWGDCLTSTADMNVWKCTACFLNNPNTVEQCMACETPKT